MGTVHFLTATAPDKVFTKMASLRFLLATLTILCALSYTQGCCEHVICGLPCPPGHSPPEQGHCDEMIAENKIECPPCRRTEFRCSNPEGYKLDYGVKK